MAVQYELNAELRSDKGKGASRRLRRNADLVPAILYGAGVDPQPLSIPHKDLFRACENEGFYSTIIVIKADGKSQEAILKDLQRHPAKNRIMHADFLRIRMDQEITVEVPIHFLNEENCVGVRQEGGIPMHNMSSVEITCLPGDLPEYIEIDVREVALGGSIHLSELELAEGLTIPALQRSDLDPIVFSVHMPRAEEVEEEVLEGEELEEGMEADAEADTEAAPDAEEGDSGDDEDS